MTAFRPAAQAMPDTTAAQPALGLRARWPVAALRAARPRQWPKNLLVFAAPLAGGSFGRDEGLGFALAATAVFCFVSVAVYLVNDVVDADRDRRHPTKRYRPIAAGQLPKAHAVLLAVGCAAAASAVCLSLRLPWLALIAAGYVALSLLYTFAVKHVPVVELLLLGSGFVLRVLGGAVATRVPPSGWFLLVCSLGALLVVTAKRYAELTALGATAAQHRPVMRWYRRRPLRVAQRLLAAALVVAYLMWALGASAGWARGWDLASTLPLVGALVRFDRLTGSGRTRPIEDLLVRDAPMIGFELLWLAMFVVGL